MPVRISASVTADTNSSLVGRASTHRSTWALGATRISSDTTSVSSSIVAASVETGRLAHRLARRRLQLDAPEGSEERVDRGAQADFRYGPVPDRGAPDRVRGPVW
ncbi:MAG: hypothetical protein OXC28_17950 [Defluviicoccus sp.]|nr:hypothetical protein [Defluviicoccus sp.]